MNGSTNILGVANFPEVKYNGYVSPKCHYFLRRILREIYVTSKKREGRADIDFSSANSCVACVPNPTQMARAFPSSFSVMMSPVNKKKHTIDLYKKILPLFKSDLSLIIIDCSVPGDPRFSCSSCQEEYIPTKTSLQRFLLHQSLSY